MLTDINGNELSDQQPGAHLQLVSSMGQPISSTTPPITGLLLPNTIPRSARPAGTANSDPDTETITTDRPPVAANNSVAIALPLEIPSGMTMGEIEARCRASVDLATETLQQHMALAHPGKKFVIEATSYDRNEEQVIELKAVFKKARRKLGPGWQSK